MDTRLQGQLDFLIEIDKMKTVLRQTLVLDRSRRENDAEHSWHIAMLALTLAEHVAFPVDLDRVIRMTLVHDLVEVYAGDTFAYDSEGRQGKEAREKAAADKLFALLPGGQGDGYRALWEEFEAMRTPDALYASAVDRLQPFISNAVTDGHTWALHTVSAGQIRERMAVVKEVLPALRDYVEKVISLNVSLGRIQPDPPA